MFDVIDGATRALKGVLAEVDPACLSGADAARMLEAFAEVERIGAAGKTMVARRVEGSNYWRDRGHRTAASWLATATGTGLGAALDTLDTAARLQELPATAEAFCAGRLSAAQVKEIGAAAEADPGAEALLMATAGSGSFRALRERCRQVRSAASCDPDADYERIRASRYWRRWADADGAYRAELRLTPDAGARLDAAVAARATQLFEDARLAGRREASAAYAADALVELVCASGEVAGGGGGATVHVRVDHAALVRGCLEAGEICEIPGIGPIPVAAARRLADDAVLKVLVTKGVDVVAVAHAGRTVPAHLRTALEERDPQCCVPGCDIRHGLEIDHRIPWAEGGQTSLDNLARLCSWHHYQKTHCDFRLEGRPGSWRWLPPEPDKFQGRAPPSRS
jgi:hypothetical protein